MTEDIIEGQDDVYTITASLEEQCWFVHSKTHDSIERFTTGEMVSWFNRVAVHAFDFKATVEATF